MSRVRVTICGLTPGLMMDPMTREKIEEIRGNVRKPKAMDQSLEQEAESKIYRDKDGQAGIPSSNLFTCLKEAGRKVKYEGRSSITNSKGETLLPTILFIEEYFLPFISHGDWTVDIRPGRNEKGQAIPIVRPLFEKWELAFTLSIDDSEATGELVRKLVGAAGKNAGLCAFRPNKGGPFGRFTVTEWEELQEELVAS